MKTVFIEAKYFYCQLASCSYKKSKLTKYVFLQHNGNQNKTNRWTFAKNPF